MEGGNHMGIHPVVRGRSPRRTAIGVRDVGHDAQDGPDP